jgi:alkanesulfonate monooxygenase SsuD/methylene tetrahydromethanopterin reductase-like flavin-dependent oxidoreductase (luciferase family)
MDIGIGLPNPIPGTEGATLIEWARRSEDHGFVALATIDRIAYPSYESLIALAAAAAVTERVGLMTNILLGPTRDPIILAKEAASVDQISGGRLKLGVAVGARPDDFVAAEKDFSDRGRRWDEALETIHRAWRGEPLAGGDNRVTPEPVNGDAVPLVIGGTSDRAIDRAVKWGIGWTAGGSAADQVGPFAERVRRAWKESGRADEPRIHALSYFALGDTAEEGAASYLSHYYGEYGARIAQFAPKTPEALRETLRRFEDAGVDEFFFDPTIAELDQIDRLADAVL